VNRIVLSGYYGFNNAGDETILYAIIRTLREIQPDIEITVLSHKPSHTGKQYNVRSVNRWRLFSILKALSSCDLLISGGGSLLQDVTSAGNPLYYLGIIFLAKLLGKQTMIYAQGIGPLGRTHNRKLAALLLNRVNRVTVRDQGSKEELAAMGVTRPVSVTADPVLGLLPDNIDAALGKQIIERNGVELEKDVRLLGVFIRSWKDNSFLPELAAACDWLAEQGWRVVFVPMHFPGDIGICKQAVKLMDQEAYYLKEMYDPEEILAIAKSFDLIVGMRLHALINGVVAGVPVVGLSYDPKIDRFLNQIGHQSLITVKDLKAQTLIEVVNWAYTRRKQICQEMEIRMQALRERARKNAFLAVELLGKQL